MITARSFAKTVPRVLTKVRRPLPIICQLRSPSSTCLRLWLRTGQCNHLNHLPQSHLSLECPRSPLRLLPLLLRVVLPLQAPTTRWKMDLSIPAAATEVKIARQACVVHLMGKSCANLVTVSHHTDSSAAIAAHLRTTVVLAARVCLVNALGAPSTSVMPDAVDMFYVVLASEGV